MVSETAGASSLTHDDGVDLALDLDGAVLTFVHVDGLLDVGLFKHDVAVTMVILL